MEAQKESRPTILIIAIYPCFYPSIESLTQNIRKGGGFPKTVTHCGHCGQVESHTFGKPQSDVPCIRTEVFCAIPRNSRGISKRFRTTHLAFVVWSGLTLVESLGVAERNAFRGRLTNNTSTRPSHTHNFIIIQASRTCKIRRDKKLIPNNLHFILIQLFAS